MNFEHKTYDFCNESDAEVILPDGMEVIKEHAFFKYKMKKAVIPASVRMIEKGAFSCCHELEEVRFLGNKTIVRKDAFLYCNEKMIVTSVEPLRFDEIYRMSGKLFLSRVKPDAVPDNHCTDSCFLRLAQECAEGNAEKMWELGIFFKSMGNEQFYQLASNFWKYRALLYGNAEAENWIRNWLSVHSNETMQALLEEQPYGDYSGNLLYCAGFITFDRQQENYHIEVLDADGIAEVMTNQEAVDYDLYDIEYYYDWLFVDEYLKPIDEIEIIRYVSSKDRFNIDSCCLRFEQVRQKAAETLKRIKAQK